MPVPTRKPKPASKPDRVTKAMIRNVADEQAVAAGCRFDEERAEHAVQWIESTCVLYEGDAAGQPLKLADWSLDVTRRLFGWVRWSDDWGRWVRRFRKASIWVPKKNGKSPTLAAWGLYLLAGDGEQGQKIYSVAKDGRQALISHTHAMEMVKRSPALSAECDINKQTGLITYRLTSSIYKVVAGDNPHSQEGLNGSVMVDETHVVDRQLMGILKGAGISRSEPLQIEVSTAGANPDSYGRERYEYAKQVEQKGGDINLLTAIYEAPQDLSEADLDADPVKWGKLANPAWGRLIKPEEYLADYQASRASATDLNLFKLYRLNIWQSAAAPWLREADWQACRQEYAAEDLAGMDCWAGLDLSRTRDLSALVLAFHFDEEDYRLLPFFWVPEERAKELSRFIPIYAWEKSGYIEITPGNVIDYGFIKARFRALAKMYNIKELAYDRTYAEELTQTLEQGQTDDKGVAIEEGTGVVRYAFRQSIMEFAGPTDDFERAVLSGKMGHNGHPVLSWQAGHVKVKVDAVRNKRPVKPGVGDYRTIDGIVAAIMAVARAKLAPRAASVYDTSGIYLL